MTRLPRKVTYTDLLQLPEDGPRYELYDGEVWEMTSPTLRHQMVALFVARLLDDYIRRLGGITIISPMDVIFSEYDVVEPDVIVFGPARRGLISMDDRVRVPPDLLVEVLSPSTLRNDRIRKIEMFARYGVPEYWIIEPIECRLELLVLRGGAYELAQTAGPDDVVTSRFFPDLTFRMVQVCPGDGPG